MLLIFLGGVYSAQAGLCLLRIVGCDYRETEIIGQLRQRADEVCSDPSLSKPTAKETTAADFFGKPKEWLKQWNCMNWTATGVRRVPDLPRAHEDPDTQAGTGEEYKTSVYKQQ